jgi:hypothetical protein
MVVSEVEDEAKVPVEEVGRISRLMVSAMETVRVEAAEALRAVVKLKHELSTKTKPKMEKVARTKWLLTILLHRPREVRTIKLLKSPISSKRCSSMLRSVLLPLLLLMLL